MSTSKASLLTLAKQGNAQAINILLNKQLQPKGITAKVSTKGSYLLIMLEADGVPNQQILVSSLKKGLESLGSSVINKVRIYGRRKGESIHSWSEEIALTPRVEPNISDLAKRGDTKAITTLIDRWLESYNITSKVNLKNGCLQVMLEALQTPSRETVIPVVKDRLASLSLDAIETVRVYGKQAGEDFPEWQQDIDFTEERIATQPNIAEPSNAKEPLNTVYLSNEIYSFIQAVRYTPYKIEAENEGINVHSAIENFTNKLKPELSFILERTSCRIIEILRSFSIDTILIKSSLSAAIISSFSNVETAIKQLERVTNEIINFGFPQEADALKAIFFSATNNIPTSPLGISSNGEAMLGALMGQVFIPVPFLGTAMGAFVGNLFANRRQKEEFQVILSKYQAAKENLLQRWEFAVQESYEKIATLLLSSCKSQLISYQSFLQAEDLLIKGNQLLEKEEFREAINHYSQAINLNPLFATAWNNIGCALEALESYDQAIEQYSRAIEIKPEFTLALNNKIAILQKLNLHEETVKVCELGIEINPSNWDVWFSMGISLNTLNYHEKSLEVWNRLTSDFNYLNFPVPSALWCNKGVTLYNLGRYEDAITAYDKAIEMNERLAMPLVRKAYILKQLERSEEAIYLYKKASTLESEDVNLLAEIAQGLNDLNCHIDALELWNKALSKNFQSAFLYFGKGYSLQNLGRYQEAIEAHNKAIEFDGNLVSAVSNKVLVLQQLGHYQEALDVCNSFLSREPNNCWILFDKGNSLHSLKQYKEAFEIWNVLLSLEYPKPALIWNNKGNALLGLERYEEAISAYNEAINIDGRWILPLSNKISALYKLKRYEEVVEICNRAINITPNNYWFWLYKFCSLQALKIYQGLLEISDKLIEIDPTIFISWYLRASYFASINDYDKSLVFLEKAMQLNPQACRKQFENDSDFESLHDNERFKAILGFSY